MFKKLPLYKAKQDTLKLGVKLINAQSKSMREVFELIRAQTTELEDIIQRNKSLLKNNTLSEIEKRAISNEIWNSAMLKARIKFLEGNLVGFIGSLVKCKNKILSINNSSHSDALFDLSPFSDKFTHIRQNIPVAFFSSNAYLQMKKTETDFETAHLNQQNILSFRMKAIGALMATLFFVSVASVLAVGVALAICVNPIAGFAILYLTAAFSAYYLHSFFEHDYMSWVEHFTQIDEKIDLGGSDESLFPELDQLVQFKHNILSESNTTVNEDAGEKFKLGGL